MPASPNKKKQFFIIGAFLGILFICSVSVAALFAYRYMSQGEGLGRLKGFVKKNLNTIKLIRHPRAIYNRDMRVGNKEDLERSIKTNGINIFTATSLDRIFQDGKTLLEPSFSKEISLSAAGNEYESFQVVVSNRKEAIVTVSLKISDLVDSNNGNKLDSGIANWRVVGYVPTKKPYYPVKYVGKWPDPLLPAQRVTIEPGMTQPFWVTIYVSKNTLAGVYQGNVEVIADEISIGVIPVKVKVFNFTLPLESHLKTAFDLYPDVTGDRYPQKKNETLDAYEARKAELNDKYIIDMLKHRINPILNIDPMNQWDLGRVDRYLARGLNNFSIGRKGGSFNNNWPEKNEEIEDLLPIYRTYGEILKFNKFIGYTYIYTWDEGDINNPRVAKVTSMIHRAHPELKNMVCYHGIWEPDKAPDWGKDIDIWCFQVDDFNESKMNVLKNRGMEMWMYVSGPGGTGSPNLAIDFDSMDYRIIPWLCWKYDIKGFLYWSVNWWPLVDPFKSAANTKWEQNGNGLLYYPGEDGPIDSLRLEVFREGMEDFEYLYLLSQKIKAVEVKNLAVDDPALINKAKALLEVDKSIAESVFSFTKNSRVLFSRRDAIARMIEELDRLLAGSS